MLVRWVLAVWGAWLGTFGLAAALIASEVRDPNPILPVALPASMLASGLGLVVGATARPIRGPRRDRAAAGLLIGSAPPRVLMVRLGAGQPADARGRAGRDRPGRSTSEREPGRWP